MGVLSAVMGLVALLQLGAGLWLAVLGQWSVIGYGVALLFLGTFGLGVAQLPGKKLVEIAELRGTRVMAAGVMLAATLWGSLCMAFWAELSAQRYLPLAHGAVTVPMWIWGYGVAVLPLYALAGANRGFWVTEVQVFACLPLYVVSVAAALGQVGQPVHQVVQAIAVLLAPVAVGLAFMREA